MPSRGAMKPGAFAAAEAFSATLDSASPVVPAAEASAKVRVTKRDRLGRFAKPKGRARKAARPVLGVRGPSYYARKPQPVLVRACVILEHQVGRLEAELAGTEWRDPVIVERSNLKQIRIDQKSDQERRVVALHQALLDMHAVRVPLDLPKRHEKIAELVSEKLEAPFAWRTLYREPFRSMWLAVDNELARHDADRSHLHGDRKRWSKPKLVARILKLRKRVLEIRPVLAERLLEQSMNEDGWDPIA